MTPQALRRRVDYWAAQLGLSHWRFTVTVGVSEPSNPGALASADASEFYDDCELFFTEQALQGSLEEVDVVVCHELLHVLLRNLQAAHIATAGLLGGEAEKLATVRFEHAQEGAIDRIAHTLASIEHST